MTTSCKASGSQWTEQAAVRDRAAEDQDLGPDLAQEVGVTAETVRTAIATVPATETGTDRSADQCYICKDIGHWSNNCPKGDGSGVRSGRCFICKESGHLAKNCKKTRKNDSRSGSPASKRGRSRSRSSSSKSRSDKSTRKEARNGSVGRDGGARDKDGSRSSKSG